MTSDRGHESAVPIAVPTVYLSLGVAPPRTANAVSTPSEPPHRSTVRIRLRR